MLKQRLLLATGAFFFTASGSLVAQTVPSLSEICSSRNLGSAIGNAECYGARLKRLEPAWKQAIEAQKIERKKQSDRPEEIDQLVEAEAKTWREHLKAKCELETSGTAGMVQWDFAFALQCEHSAIQKRLAQAKNRKSK
jgi:hypothetical protein